MNAIQRLEEAMQQKATVVFFLDNHGNPTIDEIEVEDGDKDGRKKAVNVRVVAPPAFNHDAQAVRQ